MKFVQCVATGRLRYPESRGHSKLAPVKVDTAHLKSAHMKNTAYDYINRGQSLLL